VRTRVGYAGGTTDAPTYRRIGDHTESFQVAFDPAMVSFEQLLEVFWAEHSPTSRSWSTQYAHIAFWHDAAQRDAIEGSVRRLQEVLPDGSRVTTAVRELTDFFVAEDYHQKYYLRSDRTLMREFGGMYPDAAEFRESTAAARVNGYLGGDGEGSALLAEIDSYGLSAEGRDELLRRTGMPPSASCGI
jgi:peptide-methionine (S)-S-oxide reductase